MIEDQDFSKREKIAVLFMQALLADFNNFELKDYKIFAHDAVLAADCLILELAKGLR
jgi:hypothetical protein